MGGEMTKIDKNIPIPDNLEGGGPEGPRIGWYPWSKLEAGESFIIQNRTLRSVGHSVTKMNRLKHPKQFVCREEEENNIRVWRVK
jgi:hypothetical protein